MTQNENSMPDLSVSKGLDEQDLQNAHLELLQTIQLLARERPDQFSSLILEGVLSTPYKEGESVRLFAPSAEDGLECRIAEGYKYLARVMIAKAKKSFPELPDKGFFRVGDWIEKRFWWVPSHLRWQDYRSARNLDVWRSFFRLPASHLALEIDVATILISRGVPVFIRVGDSDEYVPLDEGSQLCAYLRERGRRNDSVEAEELPDWATFLHFRADHVRWYEVFTANDERATLDDLAEQLSAFRKHIGFPPIEANDALAAAKVVKAGVKPSPAPGATSQAQLEIQRLQEQLAAIRAELAHKPIATKERNTLLTIVAALCAASGIDPTARGTATKIAEAADLLGAPVDDGTVLKWLKQVPDAVRSRSK